MPAESTAPVIVTLREVERVLQASESTVESVAEDDGVHAAQAMAAMGAILTELRKAERDKGSPRVLVTAQHGPASRLQSLIASGEAGSLQLEPLPNGGLEAKFDTQDWLGWATVAWARIKNPVKHRLLRPKRVAPGALPNAGRVALVGDWGTGLYGAPRIARAIAADRDPFALLLHLGDVYYAGTKDEVRDRFLELWPRRDEAIHRALNSNHEMYSGGYAFFDDTLPRFQQESSYFALQNDHWTLVGLDVAHRDHAIDDKQVAWLRSVLAAAGERRVILFSHHQLYSLFDSQGDKLWGHGGFAEILRSKRIFAWYWGHEHRCCIYEERDPRSGLWGRCIGHGGMPESRRKTKTLPRAPGQPRADWRRAASKLDGNGNRVPPALVLEGPNPYLGEEADDFTPHGYGVLTLDGPRLREQVLDADGEVIFENQLA